MGDGDPHLDIPSESPRALHRSAPAPTPASFDLDRLFAGLVEASALLLAVSGGPDSMALMLLAARWADSGAAPALYVATVDHGLRPEGAAEAAMVAGVAAALGLPHASLAWEGPKPTTRIQERARAARYALLVAHARSVGASHILTGHHADDQAETVLLRLGRGSGLGGLAGMRRETLLAPDVALVRPLLDLGKADLVALCREADVPIVDDPSNVNPAFARGRLRAATSAQAALGLDTATLTRLARRMARADAALDTETARIEADLLYEVRDGVLHVGLRPMAEVELEILLRVLRNVIARHGAGTPLRLDRLETLTAHIAAALRAGRPHRTTLAGVKISLSADGCLTVSRETLRRRGRNG